MTTKLPIISIIGAGLSGLTLGLTLKHKGIAAIIYDRAASAPRYNYGITLYPSTYRPLLDILGIDEASFRAKLAVNAHQSGDGGLAATDDAAHSTGFRCHRGRLEALLRNDLSIRWGEELKDVQLKADSGKVNAIFEDGSAVETACLVSCDGVHSVTRQRLSSSMTLEILPYVVFNGKRHLPLQEFQEHIRPSLQGAVIAHKCVGKTVLEVSICGISDTHVVLSYVYSRPAREDKDPLHNPDRSNAGATSIPAEFYNELDELQDLGSPFENIFNSAKVRDDRVLHWLMRCLQPNTSEVQRLSEHQVTLLGDAIHATPILGGEGANVAIKDGLDLAEWIASHGVAQFREFAAMKSQAWVGSVEDSKRRIEDMHVGRTSYL